MKQLALMLAMVGFGAVGSLYNPFWGVLLYYTLAVLRPQYLWEWALPEGLRWSLLAAAIVVGGVFINLSKVTLRGRTNPVMWLLIAYSFQLVLSTLTAHDPATSQIWGIEYGKIILIALIATLVIDRLWHVHVIGAMILLSLGYAAYEINYLYLINGRIDIYHYGYGGLDNNGAGLLLSLGLPFAYVFGVAAKHPWQRGLAWTLGVLMLHAILMSYSRGAMLAAAVGVIWLLVNHRPRWQAGMIAVVLCIGVSVLAGQEIRERFLSTTQYEQDASAQSRLDSWAAAWAVTTEHPFTGAGIRNASFFVVNHGADVAGRTIHSQYLQIAADSGLPALGVYIAIVAVAFVGFSRCRGTCRAYLNSEKPDPRPAVASELDLTEKMALGFQASLVTFAFGAMFLSLEVFEMPWLLMTIGGLLPGVLASRISELQATDPRLLEHGVASPTRPASKRPRKVSPSRSTSGRGQTALPQGA